MSFSRHVREIFIFLIVLVTASSASGIFLLTRVIHEEDSRVAAQISTALDQMRQHRLPGFPKDAKAADLAALAHDLRLGDLIIGSAGMNHGSIQWHVRRSTMDGQSDTGITTIADIPQLPKSGWAADGEYWRYVTTGETWNGQPVLICAGVPAPGLGGLLRQLRLELWVRGFIVAAFMAFAALFHRIVLLPFRDMRQRAAALVESGLLPEAPGHPTDDPEYVMSTFDVLVRQLIGEADEHRQRAVKSEKRARSIERFNEYMLTSMSTGVLILGRDGTILRVNRAAEKILRAGDSGITGRHFSAAGLYPEMIAVIEEGLRYGQLYSRREMRIEWQGEKGPLYLGVNTSLIRNEFDDVVGLSVLLTDLTEIKRLYDELAENQRLADLGEMAAGLAHQLRNSMAAILGYGKLLRDVIGPNARTTAWVDSVIGETQETAQMLERFLSFARPLSGDRAPVDLKEIVTEAIETTAALARESNIQVTLQSNAADSPDFEVLGDRLLLKQVFINLIQNGIEAMVEAGSVRITISPPVIPAGDPPRAALVGLGSGTDSKASSTYQREGILRIEIADQGSGIPETDHTHIFRPFYTSKETGTGLGLPLAKKIAVFHGGNLTLERSGPDGSVFVVTLPAQRTSGRTPGEPGRPESIGGISETVTVSGH